MTWSVWHKLSSLCCLLSQVSLNFPKYVSVQKVCAPNLLEIDKIMHASDDDDTALERVASKLQQLSKLAMLLLLDV